MSSKNSRTPRPRPHFDTWNLRSPTSGCRIFQAIGAMASLFLIGSVGSHFTATYAALMVCIMASIISPILVLAFAFNLQDTTTHFDWMMWELLYTGSFSFLFLINSITMTYSSIRWDHTMWYLAAVVCVLVFVSFVIDTFIAVRLLVQHPEAKHTDDPVQSRTQPVVTELQYRQPVVTELQYQ